MDTQHPVKTGPDDPLQKVTVIVPTYQRPQQIARALRYWGDLPVEVIVVDGSPDAPDPGLLAGLPARISYRHMPLTMAARLAVAIRAVKTPYAVLCGDDEFHLPSGLRAAVLALEADAGLVACVGRVIGFDVRAGRVRGFVRYGDMADMPIDQPDMRDRAIAQMAHYAPRSIYAVVRREVWATAIAPAALHEFGVYAIGELQFEMAVAMAGRTRVLPAVQWMRSHEVRAVEHAGADASLARRVKIEDVWTDAAFRAAFCESTARAIAAPLALSQAQAEAIIAAAAEAYVQRFLPTTKRPNTLIARLRWQFARAAGRRRQPVAAVCARLRRSGVSVDSGDLARVEAILAGK